MLNCNESHIYTDENGIIVDSVTQILTAEGYISFKGIDPRVLEAARELGTNVHIACELWAKGILDESSLSAPLIPYLDAFKKFLKKEKAEIIHIEHQVHSKRWNYCGRLDYIMYVKKIGVWDIKTGTLVHPSTGLQLAGYGISAQEEKILPRSYDRRALKLMPDGDYRIERYEKPGEINLFKSIVVSHNGRKNYVKGEFYGIDSY